MEHISCPKSDHCCVLLKFANIFPSINETGRGIIKVPNHILDSQELIDELKYIYLNEFCREPDCFTLEWWDRCKLRFRDICLDHSTMSIREDRRHIRQLYYSLDYLKRMKTNCTEDSFLPKIEKDIKDICEEISDIIDHRLTINRTKEILQLLNNNENITPKFLESFQDKKPTPKIKALRHHEEGNLISETRKITAYLKDYFSNIFSMEQPDYEAMELITEHLQKISKDDKKYLEKDFTEDEFSFALAELSNESSPGIDGLGAKFYKKLQAFYFQI